MHAEPNAVAIRSRTRSAHAPARVPALDGLRGSALLLVVGYHVLVTNDHPGSRLVTALADVQRSLWIGVDLFLALSGFLITGILYDALGTPHFLRNFYARRCLRILPVYWLAIAALTLLTLYNHVAWSHWATLLFAFAQNTPLWFHHLPAFPLDAYTSHLWSIALEEQFYLVWPLLILLLHDRQRLLRSALALAAGALLCRLLLVHHGVPFDVTYKMLPCRMDGFLLGGWLALAVRPTVPLGRPSLPLSCHSAAQRRNLHLGPPQQSAWRERLPALVFALALAVLLAAGVRERGLDWHTSRWVNGIGYSVIALGCTSLLAWTLVPGSLPQRVFGARALRLLGRYSYGTYVWHVILGQQITHAARVLLARCGAGAGLQMLGGAAAAFAWSLALGVLSYHAVEVHFLRLKRFVPEGSNAARTSG